MSNLTVGGITFNGTTGVITGAIRAEGIIPVGAIVYFANSTTPTGYIKANGAQVSRTIYADLFAAIGTVYGVGDGSTTFNLPDLRGEFLRSWDDARGIDPGRGIGSFQAQSWKTWWVTERGFGWNGGYTHTQGQIPQSAENGYQGAQFTGKWENPSGAQQYRYGTEEVRPRNRALLACIKF
jgi:phage-related tail fiber protein